MTTRGTLTSTQIAASPRTRSIPRERGHWFWGSSLEFREHATSFLLRMHEKHGDVFRTRIIPGGGDWYFVRNAEMVNAINVTCWGDFHKPRLAKQMWSLFLGNGLVPNDGPSWKRQHKLIMPGFHKKRVDAYGTAMANYATRTIDGWRPGEQRDFRKDMTRLTIAVVGKTIFDADVEGDSKLIGRAMNDVCEVLCEHVHLPLPVPTWWPSPGNRRKMRAIRTLEALIRRMVEQRRAEKRDRGDLFSHLVFAADDDGGMSEKQLRDEVMTLIFAGHETTAHALTWAWYLLATHPDKADELFCELDGTLQGRQIEVDDLPSLPYLEMVVKETMRLIPSVWSYAREPQRDIQIGDYVFPKGSPLFVSPFVLGRDARYYDRPEEYRPERWTREFERSLPRGAYVPFAGGPRVCLGKQFAMMEMRMVLGTLIQRIKPRLQPGFEPELVHELSLNPGPGGLQVHIDLRN